MENLENLENLESLETLDQVSKFDYNKFIDGYNKAVNESTETFGSLYEQAIKDAFGKESITLKEYDKVPDVSDLGPWDTHRLQCLSDATCFVGVIPTQFIVDNPTDESTNNKDSFGKNLLIGVGVAAAAAALTGIGYLIYKNIKSRKHK